MAERKHGRKTACAQTVQSAVQMKLKPVNKEGEFKMLTKLLEV
jgi:hypothetical protein